MNYHIPTDTWSTERMIPPYPYVHTTPSNPVTIWVP